MAKCVQDGRRVDLPLSHSFFKLMCVPGKRGVSSGDGEESVEGKTREMSPPVPQNRPIVSPLRSDAPNDNADHESNRTFDQPTSNQRFGSRMGSGNATYGAGLKEAEMVLASHADEISKDGSPKDEVTLEEVSMLEKEGPWFEGILDRGDLQEVNPYRSRFLKQMDQLVKQRDGILENQELSDVEKERQVAALTLQDSEKNQNQSTLEDLWWVTFLSEC